MTDSVTKVRYRAARAAKYLMQIAPFANTVCQNSNSLTAGIINVVLHSMRFFQKLTGIGPKWLLQVQDRARATLQDSEKHRKEIKERKIGNTLSSVHDPSGDYVSFWIEKKRCSSSRGRQ